MSPQRATTTSVVSALLPIMAVVAVAALRRVCYECADWKQPVRELRLHGRRLRDDVAPTGDHRLVAPLRPSLPNSAAAYFLMSPRPRTYRVAADDAAPHGAHPSIRA